MKKKCQHQPSAYLHLSHLVVCVVLALGPSISHSADAVRYFPALSHSKKVTTDSFVEEWYSRNLKALGEPSLCCGKAAAPQVYRFTWLRTFDHPVAIRVAKTPAGNWTVHTKITSGAAGYDPGTLILNKSRTASAAEIAPLATRLNSGSKFWGLPSAEEDGGGADGSQWIIEVRDGARYHYVDRWTPPEGEAHDLGLMFMKLSGADFGEVY